MWTIHYSICTFIAKFIYLFLFNKLFLLGRIIFFYSGQYFCRFADLYIKLFHQINNRPIVAYLLFLRLVYKMGLFILYLSCFTGFEVLL